MKTQINPWSWNWPILNTPLETLRRSIKMKKYQLGKLFVLSMLCMVPNGYAHAEGWTKIGATPGIPATINSTTAGTIVLTALEIYDTTNCTGNRTNTFTYNSGAFPIADGSQIYYLSTTPNSPLSASLCQATFPTRSVQISVLRTSNGICNSLSGCATVSCSSVGNINTVVSSTLAATCP